MTQIKTRRWPLSALPILADGIALLALYIFLPAYAQTLAQPSGWNALLLVLFYLLYCVGVYLIRKLKPWPGEIQWQLPTFILNPKTRGILAFFFGLLMLTTVAYQIGYFESILAIGSATLDEGDSSALLVYMPGALLGFSMLYILVLAFPVHSTISLEEQQFPILAFVGLILANGMLFFTSVQAAAIVDTLGLVNGLGVYFVAFLLLLLSFFPPRLLYYTKQPAALGLASFTILLLIASWQIVG